MIGKNSGVLLGILGLLLAGCSSKEVLKGTREELIVSEASREIKMGNDFSPVVAESLMEINSQFTQAHFNSSHCYAPLHFPTTLATEFWKSSLDFESTPALKMTASPVVAEGKVFCIDAAGIVYAFDQNTGKRLWRRSVTLAGKDGQIGGAIAYDDSRLIVTSSFAEGFSLDARDGPILWRIKLPAPCKGDGLTIHNGKAFIMCSNSSVHCVDISGGKILWSHSGMIADTTFLGSSGIAVEDGVVCFAYPSGEVYALLEETGSVIWDAMLSKFSLTNASNAFSHPRASPVVKDGVAYFVSANEQTTAFDIKSGKQLWRNDYGGIQTPIVSGNSIFVFNSKSEVVCLNKNTGKKRWLAKLTTEEKELADWYGMILIKDHLLMISPSGRVIFLSVYDGKIKKTVNIGDEEDVVSVNPVIADGIMYVLLNCGKIVAYK
ncbi:MAG: PQQ-binding-like beta-propeller repeat protein [Holosporaceae bacterium]|jgi:outer membrane protein assembly factor BamB|nr:PQQ-binding-like beta-propeller repeat protein [Holosporaceae bacterium]